MFFLHAHMHIYVYVVVSIYPIMEHAEMTRHNVNKFESFGRITFLGLAERNYKAVVCNLLLLILEGIREVKVQVDLSGLLAIG